MSESLSKFWSVIFSFIVLVAGLIGILFSAETLTFNNQNIWKYVVLTLGFIIVVFVMFQILLKAGWSRSAASAWVLLIYFGFPIIGYLIGLMQKISI